MDIYRLFGAVVIVLLLITQQFTLRHYVDNVETLLIDNVNHVLRTYVEKHTSLRIYVMTQGMRRKDAASK